MSRRQRRAPSHLQSEEFDEPAKEAIARAAAQHLALPVRIRLDELRCARRRARGGRIRASRARAVRRPHGELCSKVVHCPRSPANRARRRSDHGCVSRVCARRPRARPPRSPNCARHFPQHRPMMYFQRSLKSPGGRAHVAIAAVSCADGPSSLIDDAATTASPSTSSTVAAAVRHRVASLLPRGRRRRRRRPCLPTLPTGRLNASSCGRRLRRCSLRMRSSSTSRSRRAPRTGRPHSAEEKPPFAHLALTRRRDRPQCRRIDAAVIAAVACPSRQNDALATSWRRGAVHRASISTQAREGTCKRRRSCAPTTHPSCGSVFAARPLMARISRGGQ